MCRKNYENWFTNKNLMSKSVFALGFCIGKGDIQTSLTLDSGKCVDFIQTFGTLVSFSYFFVQVLCIFSKIKSFMFFRENSDFPW